MISDLSFPAWGVPAALVFLFLGSAFYSGAETAIVSASRARLEALAEKGRRDAQAALRLLMDAPRAISVALVGTNLCNVGTSSLATAIAVGLLPDHGPALTTVVLTPVMLLGAEILPKAFFRSHPTTTLRRSATVLRVSGVLFAPMVSLASGVARVLIRILPGDNTVRPAFRRADLESVFHASTPSAAGHEGAATLRMAGRALDLREIRVEHILAPLPPERTCEAGATVADALRVLRRSPNRFLAALDAEGRVEGFITARSLLGESPETLLERFVRPPRLLDLTDSLDELIQEFRRNQHSVGLVRDREGRTLGIVTLEDAFEELLGGRFRTRGARNRQGSERKH